MININIKGLLVDADFLMNYKNFNLSEEEAMFLLQINYLTEQGKKLFSVNSFDVNTFVVTLSTNFKSSLNV